MSDVEYGLERIKNGLGKDYYFNVKLNFYNSTN